IIHSSLFAQAVYKRAKCKLIWSADFVIHSFKYRTSCIEFLSFAKSINHYVYSHNIRIQSSFFHGILNLQSSLKFSFPAKHVYQNIISWKIGYCIFLHLLKNP
ncbi:hypothetical protein TorRG33x02_159160, partial [Trema orientale]